MATRDLCVSLTVLGRVAPVVVPLDAKRPQDLVTAAWDAVHEVNEEFELHRLPSAGGRSLNRSVSKSPLRHSRKSSSSLNPAAATATATAGDAVDEEDDAAATSSWKGLKWLYGDGDTFDPMLPTDYATLCVYAEAWYRARGTLLQVTAAHSSVSDEETQIKAALKAAGDPRYKAAGEVDGPEASECVYCFPDGHWVPAYLELFSMIVIFGSVISFVLETLPRYRLEDDGEERDDDHPTFFWIETGCIAWFTAEYLVRWLSSRNRRRFPFEAMNIVDLVAILPYYIGLMLGGSGASSIAIIRILRLARVSRLFKVSRHFQGLADMISSVAASGKELTLFAIIGIVGSILFGSLIFYAEEPSNPDDFISIPLGMWWGIITMTTVGYGDVAVISTQGRIIGYFVASFGVALLAIPAGVFISEFMRQNEARQKLKEGTIVPSSLGLSRLEWAIKDGLAFVEKERHNRARLFADSLDDGAQGILPLILSPGSGGGGKGGNGVGQGDNGGGGFDAATKTSEGDEAQSAGAPHATVQPATEQFTSNDIELCDASLFMNNPIAASAPVQPVWVHADDVLRMRRLERQAQPGPQIAAHPSLMQLLRGAVGDEEQNGEMGAKGNDSKSASASASASAAPSKPQASRRVGNSRSEAAAATTSTSGVPSLPPVLRRAKQQEAKETDKPATRTEEPSDAAEAAAESELSSNSEPSSAGYVTIISSV
eukprot:m.487284 g.487284  ORF g.487284 m.487284 type:complete len:714 (+) comp24928_c0_seq1:204-2345(+)